jgi:hypothetical protein
VVRKGDFNILEIGSRPCTNTALLRRGVDADKDEVGLLNGTIDICREEQVAATRLADDILQSGLIDGKLEVRAVPGIDSRLVQVDNRDLDMGAFDRDDGASRTTFSFELDREVS